MMHYTVKSRSHNDYEVWNEQGDNLGSMSCNTWAPYKATIITSMEQEYNIAPTGFWRTNVLVTKNDMPVVEIKPVLGRGLSIIFGNSVHPYLFKKKSFWNSDYVLVDDNEQEIAFIQSDYKWRTWSFNYEIDIHSNALDTEINLLLPLLLSYCARYMRMRHSGS